MGRSMGKGKFGGSSIVGTITALILGVIGLQTLLLMALLMGGGVVDQARKNAFQSFHDKVNGRKDYLQREMKDRWTNLDPYLADIRRALTRSKSDPKLFFPAVSGQLVQILRTSQATGIFIILNAGDQAEELPALYFRDYDPRMNPYSNDDIYMVYGPPSLADSMRIPMDQTWQFRFHPDDQNQAFLNRPFQIASVSTKASFLGYWSKPFKLNPNDVAIVTYSLPLFDEEGGLQGVIGTEITLNQLSTYLPAHELQPQDSLGYLITFGEGTKLDTLVLGGAMQRRLIKKDQPLDLVEEDPDRRIYRLAGLGGADRLYAAVEGLGLYKSNSPFEADHWQLVGLMRESYLFRYADRISQGIWISIIVSLAIAVAGGILVSRRMARPIVSLAKLVQEQEPHRELHIPTMGLRELDDLSRALELANQRTLESASRLSKVVELLGLPLGAYEVEHGTGLVSVTGNFWSLVGVEPASTEANDGPSFLKLLARLFSEPERGESDVYRMANQRWVRNKQTDSGRTIVGIVMDVTVEMQEKQAIQRERDHDPLTQLLNRKGFQWEFEDWYRNYSPSQGVAALVMFDLDNLKKVNDTYGHKWGDQYIVSAVARLKQIATEPQHLLGRRSGDEFVLLLRGFSSIDAVRGCLDSFYRSLATAEMMVPDGRVLPISISAGLTWVGTEGFSYDELLHFADEALYGAKKTQKGTYVESSVGRV